VLSALLTGLVCDASAGVGRDSRERFQVRLLRVNKFSMPLTLAPSFSWPLLCLLHKFHINQFGRLLFNIGNSFSSSDPSPSGGGFGLINEGRQKVETKLLFKQELHNL